jgi:hypothetical protein
VINIIVINFKPNLFELRLFYIHFCSSISKSFIKSNDKSMSQLLSPTSDQMSDKSINNNNNNNNNNAKIQMEDCDNDCSIWDIILILIFLVILLKATTFGVDLYVKLRLYIENHGKILANTKFFGLASAEGREGFASSLINLSFLKPDFPIYVDQLNNLFLGTGERDPYDPLKAENTIKDWLNAGLINESQARESLSFKTYLLYYPDDKYNPTNIPREEGTLMEIAHYQMLSYCPS